MVFLRRKNVNGREYVYEVASYRNSDGVPRQRVLRYLGPTDPIYARHEAVDLFEARRDLEARLRHRSEP